MKKINLWLLGVSMVALISMSGCLFGTDENVKRGVSLMNVKTHVFQQEFNSAATPDAKINTAKEYLSDVVTLTQSLDDYYQGRAPIAAATIK